MHIAVIDPGTRVPELDCFNRLSRRSPVSLTYHLPALFGLDSLRDAGPAAGVVVLGSGASVNDGLPWQHALDDWLLPRLTGGTPALGLCYGHQLFARLLGGEVDYRSPDQARRAGVRQIQLADDPLWGEARGGPVLVSHRQEVKRLPDGLEVVGWSDEVAVEAFAHRALPLWGFQSHPEATPAFARNNDVPFDGSPEVLAFGHTLVDAFLDRVARGL